MATVVAGSGGSVIWKGRPSVGPYVALYGILAVAVTVVLIAVELTLAGVQGLSIIDRSFTLGGFKIPYTVEVATAILVLVAYLAKLGGLALMRARNRYELRTDGFEVNSGIANLERTFISPLAFSDTRLVRTAGMRLIGRSKIIVDTNDGRNFELALIKDGAKVQNLIRESLGRPVVRLEGTTKTTPPSP